MLASDGRVESPYPNCPLCHLLAEPVASSKETPSLPAKGVGEGGTHVSS